MIFVGPITAESPTTTVSEIIVVVHSSSKTWAKNFTISLWISESILWIVKQDLFVPVFSPRVVGIAVARYDFCSRDTRELSLQQGDIIKIYTKMSNGWWKGEVDGRVGLLWDPVQLGQISEHPWFHLYLHHHSDSSSNL